MGSVFTVCTGVEDNKVKLEKAEKENDELRKQLIQAKEAYRELQETLKEKEREKKHKLHGYKSEAKQQILKEQKEKKRLADRFNAQHKRLSLQEQKANKLAVENAKLQEQLAQAQAAVISQEDEAYTSSSDEHIAPVQAEEEEKDASPRTDMVKLRNWLAYRNLKEKALKTEVAKLLTLRNESHRSKIPEAYKQRYGTDIMDDIGKIIKKGHVLELIDGLFMTKAQFDAYCIRDIVKERSNKAVEVGQILCCRNINELQLMCHEYKRMYGGDLRDKVYKLSNGKTYQNIVNRLFSFSTHDHETTNKLKIQAKVQGDVGMLRDKNIKWKSFDNKQKLQKIIMGNNPSYVSDVARLFFKEANMNLTDFIDENLGEKSTSGSWLKLRIEFCLDPYDFYARQIQICGEDGINKGYNAKEINRVFISTFDNDLKYIQKKFNDLNYGNGKSMIVWINKVIHKEKYVFFLTKMLENCSRFGS